MKTLSPTIQNLIDKLKLAEEIYGKAASRVHNQPMKDQLSHIAARKAEYINELEKDLGIRLKDHHISISDRIKLELEKAEIEINHILIHRNERAVLSFCLNREKELVQSYLNIVMEAQKEGFEAALFISQLDETRTLMREMEQTKKAYEFEDQ